jgi:hypothetical protein
MQRIASTDKSATPKKAQMMAEHLSGSELAIYQILMESGLVSTVEDVKSVRWDLLAQALNNEAVEANLAQEQGRGSEDMSWNDMATQEIPKEDMSWNDMATQEI